MNRRIRFYLAIALCGACGCNRSSDSQASRTPPKTDKIQIVGHWECGGAKEEGLKAAREAMQAHPDLVGIFAINDPAALGARAAVEAEGKQAQIVIIGFDGQPEAKQAIKDGKLFDTPVQAPDQMAKEAVEAIVKYFQGEKVDPKMLIDTTPYRLEQALEDPELSPDAEPQPGEVALDEVKGTIGLSVQNLTNPFFKLIEETITREAAKHGYEVLSRDAQRKIELQKDQVDEFLVKEVDAIVLCPCQTKAIGAVIRRANEKNIPVFTIDTICEDADAQVVFHVGTNNVQGGQVAGQAMIDALGDVGGKVGILEFKSVESCIDRVTGFTQKIDEFNAAQR